MLVNGNAPGPKLLHAPSALGDPELWKRSAEGIRSVANEVTDDEALRILARIAESFELLERMARG